MENSFNTSADFADYHGHYGIPEWQRYAYNFYAPTLAVDANGDPVFNPAERVAAIRTPWPLDIQSRHTQSGGQYISGARREVALAIPIITGKITMRFAPLAELAEVAKLLGRTDCWVEIFGHLPLGAIERARAGTEPLPFPFNIEPDGSVVDAHRFSAVRTRDLRVSKFEYGNTAANPSGEAVINFTAEWPAGRAHQAGQ